MTAVQGMGMAARAAPSPLQPQPGCQHTWHRLHHPGLPVPTVHTGAWMLQPGPTNHGGLGTGFCPSRQQSPCPMRL